MKWTRGQRSGNVEDARGRASGGGLSGLPIPTGKGGIVSLLLFLALAVFGSKTALDGGGSSGGGGIPGLDIELPQLPATPAQAPPSGDTAAAPDPERELVEFVSFVLDDVQDLWRADFRRSGRKYEDARLVLFRSQVSTGCGGASAAVGPFYCPADQTVYIDLGFFRELQRRFGAPGDFAQAYVIAHEVGHHVQHLARIDTQVRQEASRNPDVANELSIRQELQADCLAGVWGHTTQERGLLEAGDLEEGLTAAAAVGDDRIQQAATGQIDQESWTHGSADQRTTWFSAGFDSGDANRCDTFSVEQV